MKAYKIKALTACIAIFSLIGLTPIPVNAMTNSGGNYEITQGQILILVNQLYEEFRGHPDTDIDGPDRTIEQEITLGKNRGYVKDDFEALEPMQRDDFAIMITDMMKRKDSNLDKISKYNDFKEISENALSSVEAVIENKYMVGDNNNFRPNDNVRNLELSYTYQNVGRSEKVNTLKTRYNVIKFLNRCEFPELVYRTVTTQEELEIAKKLGVISSIESARPYEYITREELATMVSNYSKKKDTNLNKIKNYSDFNQISSWAQSSVEAMVEDGIMVGNGVSFRPKDIVTNDEFGIVIENIKMKYSISVNQ